MFLLCLRQFPWCGDQTPASVPLPAEGRSSPANTPGFPLVPSSYQVLRGSIYSFPLVRSSCLLSAGVLHALLCLQVYSWYICGERCTPCPPTPPPFCSLPPYGCINPEITFPDKMTPSDTLKYMKRVSQDFKRKLCLPIFYRTLNTLELSFQNHPVSTQNVTFCKSYWLKEW